MKTVFSKRWLGDVIYLIPLGLPMQVKLLLKVPGAGTVYGDALRFEEVGTVDPFGLAPRIYRERGVLVRSRLAFIEHRAAPFCGVTGTLEDAHLSGRCFWVRKIIIYF